MVRERTSQKAHAKGPRYESYSIWADLGEGVTELVGFNLFRFDSILRETLRRCLFVTVLVTFFFFAFND